MAARTNQRPRYTTDPPDVNELLQQHRATAHRAARKFAPYLPPTATFDDLFAVCWVAAWRAIRATQGGRTVSGSLADYVFRSAINHARRFIQVEQRRGVKWAAPSVRVRIHSEPAEGLGLPLVERARARVAEERVQWSPARWKEVLACLSPKLRRLVTLRLLRGQTVIQTAKGMKCSENTVLRMWWEALVKIREAHPELKDELAF